MAHAVAVVFQESVLSGQSARACVELGSEAVGINKRFEYGNVAVLIGVGIGRIQRVDEETWEVSSVCFLAISCGCYHDPTLCRQALGELPAGTRHVNDNHSAS